MVLMQAKNFTKAKNKWGARFWLPLIICILLLRCFVCTSAIVQGTSMYPTFHDGQIVIINKLAYITKQPEIGDIIIAIEPVDNDKVIKRITGIPGSMVSYQGKYLQLKEGEYFIEGDNVDSIDSKTYGPIEESRILGKVITRR